MHSLNKISETPLVQLCDVGEASAVLVFRPAEVDVDKVFDRASDRLMRESFGTVRLKKLDLELGLLQLYTQPALNNPETLDLEQAAKLVANELARTCIASPYFDGALYSEPA